MTARQRRLRVGAQAYGVLIALAGIIWLYIGVTFLIAMIRESDFGLTPMVILGGGLGGICLAIGYRAVFRYSERAISHLAGITGFIICGVISQWSRVAWVDAWNGKDIKAQAALIIIPILVGWLSYRLIRWSLTRWTLEGDEKMKEVEQ